MKILKLLLALTALALTTSVSRADPTPPLLGAFAFGGTAHMIGPTGFTLGTATGFDSATLIIDQVQGDFTSVLTVGDALTPSAGWWDFSDPSTNVWTAGPLTFTPDHYTYFQPITGITVTGGEITGVEGYLSIVNFTFFNLQDDGTVSMRGQLWSGAGFPPNPPGVPAGGATALLLLGSLAGLGLIRLRLA